MYSIICTVYYIQCTVYTVHCTVCYVQCATYSLLRTVYDVQCTTFLSEVCEFPNHQIQHDLFSVKRYGAIITNYLRHLVF